MAVIYLVVEQQFQISRDGRRGAAEPARGTTAVDRGAELLVRVLESEQPVALAELASASGIPKSTASRLVSALERQGLIEQDGERGRLRPGPAILRVAERGLLERSVVELARPSLDALGELSGETINLAVPARHGVEHVAQVESRHFLGAGQWLGRSVDYHCTAVGKVFLAFGRATMPARPLTRLTEHTIIDPAAAARRARGGPPRGVRHRRRRARGRPGRDRGPGARRRRRGRGRAQHLRTDDPDDPGADRRAQADPDRGGADAEPPPRQPRPPSKENTPHDA